MIKINQYNGEMIYVGGESNFVLITGKEIPIAVLLLQRQRGGDEVQYLRRGAQLNICNSSFFLILTCLFSSSTYLLSIMYSSCEKIMVVVVPMSFLFFCLYFRLYFWAVCQFSRNFCLLDNAMAIFQHLCRQKNVTITNIPSSQSLYVPISGLQTVLILINKMIFSKIRHLQIEWSVVNLQFIKIRFFSRERNPSPPWCPVALMFWCHFSICTKIKPGLHYIHHFFKPIGFYLVSAP